MKIFFLLVYKICWLYLKQISIRNTNLYTCKRTLSISVPPYHSSLLIGTVTWAPAWYSLNSEFYNYWILGPRIPTNILVWVCTFVTVHICLHHMIYFGEMGSSLSLERPTDIYLNIQTPHTNYWYFLTFILIFWSFLHPELNLSLLIPSAISWHQLHSPGCVTSHRWLSQGSHFLYWRKTQK